MSKTVLASVVVSSYNYASYVGEAIESALGQTYARAEVVVVDDGSTDDSWEVVASYGDRVRAIRKRNGGQASALNAGLLACRGEVVVFLDSDDLLLPTALERAVDLLGDPSVAKVHWPMREVDASGRATGSLVPREPLRCGDLSGAVLGGGPASYAWPPTSGNAWSRGFLERVLPIPEETFRVCPDLYLAALAPLFGRVERVNEPQSAWRVHGTNNTWRGDFAGRHADAQRQLERCFEAIAEYGGDLGFHVDVDRMRASSWRQIDVAAEELAALLAPDDRFILVDGGAWERELLPRGRPAPFVERDGVYWGPPADDETAVRELERMRAEGARYMVFAWPQLWWLDHYAGTSRHLRSRYPCVLENERLVVFDLGGKEVAR